MDLKNIIKKIEDLYENNKEKNNNEIKNSFDEKLDDKKITIHKLVRFKNENNNLNKKIALLEIKLNEETNNNKNLNGKIINFEKDIEVKEKIINEEKNNNKKLNEEIKKLQNIIKDKENIINKEKNNSKVLNSKITTIQNKIKDKEKIIIEKTNDNKKLNEEIIKLQKLINDKENIINEKTSKIDVLNEKMQEVISFDNKNAKICELFEKLDMKQNEINKIKSKFPFELSEEENLMTIIFVSCDQKIHYSVICKNTDKFTRIEHLLYEKYPEYINSENYFILNGNKINKYKTVEENNIKNSDIITLNTFDEI